MKNMFPGHYAPTREELKMLWEDGTFVFDTSVLLNLYSYAEQAREEVMKVLNELAPSTWIPYLVMSEFHRNRYSRINSGNDPLKRLEGDLRKMSSTAKDGFREIDFERRNTGINDINQRLENFDKCCELLIAALVEAKKKLPRPGLGDDIAGRLASMYDGMIGAPPVSRNDLDELLKDGEKRFSEKIPPGFKDNRTKENIHRIGGLSYEARYGDLVIWRQIMDHARSNKLKSVVFITAERKEDWWQKGAGGKEDILGPLPELIEEFTRETGVKFFWIYSIEEFLQLFKDQANKDISSATISEVKAVSLEQDNFKTDEVHNFLNGLNVPDRKTLSSAKIALAKARSKFNISRVAADLLERYEAESHEISDEGVLLVSPGNARFYKVMEFNTHDFSFLREAIASPMEIFLYDRVTVVLIIPSGVWRAVQINGLGNMSEFISPILDKEGIFSLQLFEKFNGEVSFVHEFKNSNT